MMLSALVACSILLQLCFMGVLINIQSKMGAFVVLINIIALVGIYIFIRKGFFDLIKLAKRKEMLLNVMQEELEQWSDLYKHPLIIKPEQEIKFGIATQMEIIMDPEKKPSAIELAKANSKHQRSAGSERKPLEIIEDVNGSQDSIIVRY